MARTVAAPFLIARVEGDWVKPLIQRRMIFVTPAPMLIGVAIKEALAGLSGIMLAALIVVALFVGMQKAYVH